VFILGPYSMATRSNALQSPHPYSAHCIVLCIRVVKGMKVLHTRIDGTRSAKVNV
jgi:hypothetical protein